MAAVRKVYQSLQSTAGTQGLVRLVSDWSVGTCAGLWLPGVHALHQDLVLFTLHHVVGEHGVKVRDRGRQNNPVSAELMIPDLQRRQPVFSIGWTEHSVENLQCSVSVAGLTSSAADSADLILSQKQD